MNCIAYLLLILVSAQGISSLWGMELPQLDPERYPKANERVMCDDPTNEVHRLGMTHAQWKKHLDRHIKPILKNCLIGKREVLPAIWQDKIGPCLGLADLVFPVSHTLKHTWSTNRDSRALLWHSKDGFRAAFEESGLPADHDGINLQHINRVVMVDTRSGETLYTICSMSSSDGYAQPVFSADDRMVAFRNKDKIQVRDVSSGDIIKEFVPPNACHYLGFSPQGNFLFSVDRHAFGNDPGVAYFDLATKECVCISGSSHRSFVIFNSDETVLALSLKGNRIKVLNTKTKKEFFETDGRNFDMASDGSRIAVEHDNRIKIFDLNSVEADSRQKKELFHMPGKSDSVYHPLRLTPQNKIIFNDVNSNAIIVGDVSSRRELIQLAGFDCILSPNEEYIAINRSHEDERNAIYLELYCIASRKKIFEIKQSVNPHFRNGKACFSPDSHYLIAPGPQATMIFDLMSKEAQEVHGNRPAISPDSRFCALSMRGAIIPSSQRSPSSALEFIIFDLKQKKEVARYKADSIYQSPINSSFLPDNKTLHVGIEYSEGRSQGGQHWFFDVSGLKDKRVQDIFNNKLMPEQITLLMLLDEAQKKNNNRSLSLLHDITYKTGLSLRELQAELANFHPLVGQSIIKRYGIIDPTPEATKIFIAQKRAAEKQKSDALAKQNNDALEKQRHEHARKSFWKNALKITGCALVVTACVLGARWYFKNK